MRSEKGQTLPIVVFFLLILLGIVSLVIDGGMAYAQRRFMQNAADAASLAGVTLMTQGVTSDAQINSRAVQYGQANRAMTVTVDYVDTAGGVLARAGQGTYPSGANGLKVTAHTVYRPGIASVLGLGAFNIAAEATANIRMEAGNALILALDSSACAGLNASGSGTVTAIGGNIQVNSNCDMALNHTGGGTLRAVDAAINVTGLYRQTGNGLASPPPNIHMPVIPDPLARLDRSEQERHGCTRGRHVCQTQDAPAQQRVKHHPPPRGLLRRHQVQRWRQPDPATRHLLHRRRRADAGRQRQRYCRRRYVLPDQ